MKELSLHILDIAQNSLKAGAKRVEITVTEDPAGLAVTVADDGCGMTPELLATVTDPFTTTRTTRKVGLGIPLLKMAAEQTGGFLTIDSLPGKGTTLRVSFTYGHIDTPPLGDIPSTMTTLIQGAPDVDFLFTHEKGGRASGFDTRDAREQLGGEVPLDDPDVLAWIGGYLAESEADLESGQAAGS